MQEGIWALAAQILGLREENVRREADISSFVELGGSSFLAIWFSATAEEQLGVGVSVAGLLSREPLATVIATAGPGQPPPAPDLPARTLRPLLPGQAGMLHLEETSADPAYHLLFSVQVRGASADQCADALAALVARHESLRTVFTYGGPDGAAYGRRVLAPARPRVARQVVRPGDADALAVVHGQLAAASGVLIRPFEQVPAHFTVTQVIRDDAPAQLLVSMLIHHALADGWSVGILFREYCEILAGCRPRHDAPSPEGLLARYQQDRTRDGWRERFEEATKTLHGAPAVLELPSDVARPEQQATAGHRLTATFSQRGQAAWQRLAGATGCTKTAVLLAAYALALARRCGVSDLLIGMPAAALGQVRPAGLVAPCANVIPVRCRIEDDATCRRHITATADALAAALRHADVSFMDLTRWAAGRADRRRSPLVQFVLGAHDELIPASVRCGDIELLIHEGHCGNSPFDATLFLQRAGSAPRLALEYATSALSATEAAELLDGVDAALIGLAEHLDAPLREARAISAAQELRLSAARYGPEVPPGAGDDSDVWGRISAVADANPGAIALEHEDVTLSYQQLQHAVWRQAALLATSGVRDGDGVLLAVPRSTAEVISVLAVLACGAHYVPADPDTPDDRLRVMLDVARPRAVLAARQPAYAALARRAAALAPQRIPVVTVIGSNATEAGPGSQPDELPPDPGRLAYIAFTSGSTGTPKGVRVPQRAVSRLVAPGPQCSLQCGPGQRMMRFAPLAFDASTLEIFAPLAAGGTLVVFPDAVPAPAELAAFLAERKISVLWLTAGLFRLVADYAPAGFGAVRHLLTGGDVVPPQQVRKLLERFPGLRVTNGYGPTENTTFSTVLHLDDPAEVTDPLPIGTAVAGSGTLVLDEHGGLVPPGGIGELCVTGAGLALGYAGAPEQTQTSFGTAPDGEDMYRTGDIVRLDGAGLFRYLGRRDRQVKIRGFRIELDEIGRMLTMLPGVRSAVVVAAGEDASTRKLVAGVIPAADHTADPAAWSDTLAARLPEYAVPRLWTVVEAFPLTSNGKLDTEELAARAAPASDWIEAWGDLIGTSRPSATAPDPADSLAAAAWRVATGRDPAGPDTDFFAAGGDSLALAKITGWLRKEHNVRVPVRDFYAAPTLRNLTELCRRGR